MNKFKLAIFLLMIPGIACPGFALDEESAPVMLTPVTVTVAPEVRAMLPAFKKAADAKIEESRQYLKDNKVIDAINSLYQVLKMSPYDPRPYILIAHIYIQLEKRDLLWKLLEDVSTANTHQDYVYGKVMPEISKLTSVTKNKHTEKVSLARFKGDRKAAVSFVFDDGAKSVYTEAVPILEKYGYAATFAINPGSIPDDGHEHPILGSWAQWKDAHQRGFEIANHALHHSGIPEGPEDLLDREINTSFEMILKNVGAPPRTFVFPSDVINAYSLNKAKERHIVVRNHDYLTELYKSIFIPWYGGQYFSIATANQFVDIAKSQNLWLIPVGHAITDKDIRSFKPISADLLENHLAYIKQNEQDVWVDTFYNVYRYLAQKKAAVLSYNVVSGASIEFTLDNRPEMNVAPTLLTVVIDTAPNPAETVSAVQPGGTRPLHTRIANQKIYVDVYPSDKPVQVYWELADVQ